MSVPPVLEVEIMATKVTPKFIIVIDKQSFGPYASPDIALEALKSHAFDADSAHHVTSPECDFLASPHTAFDIHDVRVWFSKRAGQRVWLRIVPLAPITALNDMHNDPT